MAGLVLVQFLFAPLSAQNARSVDASPIERQRAEFLLRLPRFVHWPDSTFPSPDAALDLCVVGAQPDDFVRLLRLTAADARAPLRPIQVRALRPDHASDSCHLLYVQGDLVVATARPPRYLHIVESLAALEQSGMLAMVPEYTNQGESVLRFHGRRDRLRGEVPVLSAQLLKLVRFPATGS